MLAVSLFCQYFVWTSERLSPSVLLRTTINQKRSIYMVSRQIFLCLSSFHHANHVLFSTLLSQVFHLHFESLAYSAQIYNLLIIWSECFWSNSFIQNCRRQQGKCFWSQIALRVNCFILQWRTHSLLLSPNTVWLVWAAKKKWTMT